MPKRTIEEEINDFVDCWDSDTLTSLLTCMLPIIELYNVTEDVDWVKDAVGNDDVQNVRIIRTVYLISKFADLHAGRLSRIKAQFPQLWRRLQPNKIDEQGIL